MSDLHRFVKYERRELNAGELLESSIPESPFELFEAWMNSAKSSAIPEPNAMHLCTATPAGKPSSRIVLLRGMEENGFLFYTNYKSRKAKEMEDNPQVSLTFYWMEAAKQIRIEGIVTKLNSEISDDYFASRPRDSQLGAWASEQSAVLKSRTEMEQRAKELELKFSGEKIPRPPFWGGYSVAPSYFEFWQGRPSRLHDRIAFSKDGIKWKIVRLNP